MEELISQFVENWGEWAGAIAALIIAFNAIARVTPTETDNKVVKWINKIARVIGLDIPDNPGKLKK